MVITLKNELIMNSYKTIDGRGAKVEIAYGPCITIQGVSNIIIHGITIHDCKPGNSGLVISTPIHVGHRLGSDGDGISVFASSNVWIDHCSLSRCSRIFRVVIIIHLLGHFLCMQVMLLGHEDNFLADKIMKVTIIYNHFGSGLVQRMPRYKNYTHTHTDEL